jgi:hypothetical protein
MNVKYFKSDDFEKNNKNLVLIEDFGFIDENLPKVFLNKDDNCYYARGYWQGPKYNFLRYVKIDFIDIDIWISNMKKTLLKK